MKNTNNTIFKRFWLGIKKGYSIPNLPPNILKLHNSVPIRYLRITGGLSALLLISGRLENLGLGKLYPFLYLSV